MLGRGAVSGHRGESAPPQQPGLKGHADEAEDGQEHGKRSGDAQVILDIEVENGGINPGGEDKKLGRKAEHRRDAEVGDQRHQEQQRPGGDAGADEGQGDVPHHPQDARPGDPSRLFQSCVHPLQRAEQDQVRDWVAVEHHHHHDAPFAIDRHQGVCGAGEGLVDLVQVAHGSEQVDPGDGPDEGRDQVRDGEGRPEEALAGQVGPGDQPGQDGAQDRASDRGIEADLHGVAQYGIKGRVAQDAPVMGEAEPAGGDEAGEDQGERGVDDDRAQRQQQHHPHEVRGAEAAQPGQPKHHGDCSFAAVSDGWPGSAGPPPPGRTGGRALGSCPSSLHGSW